MPADASIYGMIRPQQQMAGPMEQFAQMQQVRQLMDAGETSALQRRKLESDLAEEEAFKQAFRSAPGGKVNVADLMGVSPTRALAYQKSELERQKEQAAMEKSQVDRFASAASAMRDVVASAGGDADMPMVKEAALRLFGPDIAAKMQIPDRFDPAWQQRTVMTGNKLIEGLEAQKNRDLTTRGQNLTDTRTREGQAETRRHNLATEAGAEAARIEAARANAAREAKEKDPNDTERTAAGYASRMAASSQILGELESAGVGKPEYLEMSAGSIPLIGAEGRKVAKNAAMSPQRQQYRQAQEDWVRAKLRKESGAVIADDEMDREIRVYFPQVGDSPEALTQKAAARKTAEDAMRQSAGRATVIEPAPRPKKDTKPASGTNRPSLNEIFGA